MAGDQELRELHIRCRDIFEIIELAEPSLQELRGQCRDKLRRFGSWQYDIDNIIDDFPAGGQQAIPEATLSKGVLLQTATVVDKVLTAIESLDDALAEFITCIAEDARHFRSAGAG